jgi:hypothetical protein
VPVADGVGGLGLVPACALDLAEVISMGGVDAALGREDEATAVLVERGVGARAGLRSALVPSAGVRERPGTS